MRWKALAAKVFGSGYTAAGAMLVLTVSALWVCGQIGSTAGEVMRRPLKSIRVYVANRPDRHRFVFYHNPGNDSRIFLREEVHEYEDWRTELWRTRRRVEYRQWMITSGSMRRGWWAPVAVHRGVQGRLSYSDANVSNDELHQAIDAGIAHLAEHNPGWQQRWGDLVGLDPMQDRQWIVSGIIHNLIALAAAVYLLSFCAWRGYGWYRRRRFAPGLCQSCGYDLRGAAHTNCPECGTSLPAPATHRL